MKSNIFIPKKIKVGFNLRNDTYTGYNVDSWISDLKSRFSILNRKAEEARLKKLEDKLHELLSTDKKVELELDNLAKLI